jgi:autotransporter-associated beta strand protein
MRHMTWAMGVMGLIFVTMTRAATYTWDGGGTDNNWSTGANWAPDDSVPVSASDTLVKLDGTTRVTTVQNVGPAFEINRLEYLNGPVAGAKAGFQLNGESFRFVANGATQPRVYLNRDATCTMRNDIEIPAGTTLFMEIGTYAVDFRGVISGEGGIDKLNNAGGISLYNPTNSFAGGLIIRAVENDNWRKVNIYGSGAMGTGPVSLYGGSLGTRFNNPGGLIFYGATVQTNPVSLFQNSPIFVGMPNGADVVTLNGPVDLNSHTLYLRGGGNGTIGGAVGEGGATALIKLDRGTWTLAGANTFTGAIAVSNGVFRLGAAGALDPLVPVAVSCATGWHSVAAATFDLNGFNQTVSQLSGMPALSTLTNILTSATPATLTVNQAGDSLFAGRLAGAASLVKAGAGTLTLSNAFSTTTGSITVSNGTLAVAAAGSLGGASTLAIAAGGAKLSLAAGVTEPVLTLVLDGVAQTGGTYGATGSGAEYEVDDYFAGAGVLFVQRGASVTWDGEGSDLLLSTPENWAGDAVPGFKWDDLTFGTGGLTAVVDRAVSLYGLTFNRDANFVVAAGGGAITNGARGILAQSPTTTGRTYTLGEAIVLAASQEWLVTNNTAGITTLTVSGPLHGSAGSHLTKTGNGTLTLSGDSSFEGVLTATLGDLIVTHGNALGSTGGKTVVISGTGAALSRGAQLVLRGGVTLSEPLEVSGMGDGGFNGVLVNGDSDNVLEGPVTLLGSSRYQAYAMTGSLRFRGGISGNATFTFAYGNAIVEGVPLSLGGGLLYVHSGNLILLNSGHAWAASSIGWDGVLRAGAAHVLPTDKPFLMGSHDAGAAVHTAGKAVFDLNGLDQGIGSLGTEGSVLAAGVSSGATRIIWSASPAALTVHQAVASTFDGAVTGRVSVVKAGAAQLTLSGTNTTFGSFTVSNGTLRVGASGTLGVNSTNVVVAGGSLSLAHSAALSDQATLQLLAGGQVSLDVGVDETIAWLNYGGTPRRAGTYGSTASPATYKDDTRFAGSGVLRVLRDKSGMLIRLQ